MKTTLLNIAALLAGTALFCGGCDKLTAPTPPSVQEQWQHDAQTEQSSREWSNVHDGFAGAFACHTADGGCLHMTCTTKNSCDYMQEVEKKCAAPTVQDVKIIAKVVVADDSCKPVEQALQSTYIVGAATNGHVVSNSDGTITWSR